MSRDFDSLPAGLAVACLECNGCGFEIVCPHCAAFGCDRCNETGGVVCPVCGGEGYVTTEGA